MGFFLSDGIDLIQIARKGDSLHGSAISSLAFEFDHGGPNNFGQVAYKADTLGGISSIHRFTPDLYWRSPTGGDWSENSNWTLGLNPAAVHDVYAQSDSNVSIGGPVLGTVKNLYVGSATGADRQGQVALNLNGSNLTVGNNAIVNTTGNDCCNCR